MAARKAAAARPAAEKAEPETVDTPAPAAEEVAEPEAPRAPGTPRPLRFVTPQGVVLDIKTKGEPGRQAQSGLGRPLRFGGNS